MSTKLSVFMFPLAFVLLTIVACTREESAPLDSEVAVGEVTPSDSNVMVTSTAVVLETLPSGAQNTPTPSPLPITASPAPTSDLETTPLQPDPTATSIIPTPTRKPTVAPLPTSSVVPGWLTYENKFLGYSLSYPPEARIRTSGVTGFPTDELPENKTVEEYQAELEEKYPYDLCVSVGYKRAFITIRSTDETLSAYASPCGITGVGDYTIEHWEEVVTIDGQPYTAGGNRLTGGARRCCKSWAHFASSRLKPAKDRVCFPHLAIGD